MGAVGYLSIVAGLLAGILSAIVYSQYEVIFEGTVSGMARATQPLVKSTTKLHVLNEEPTQHEHNHVHVHVDRSEYAVGGNSYYIKLPLSAAKDHPIKDDVLALSSYLNQFSKTYTFDPQLNTSVLFDNVKMLCYVISPRHNVGSNGKSIVKSWAYHCNKLVILSSIDNKDFGAINIKMPEGKKDAWSRAKLAMQYIHDNFIDDYDWFVKLEQDSVVVAENIRYMVLMNQANIPGYAGQVLSGERTTGSVHILSNQALRQIVPKIPECSDKVGGMADDLELDECLSVAGMTSSTDGRDQDGVQRFQIVMPDHKLPANTNGYTVWYWRYIRKPEIEVSITWGDIVSKLMSALKSNTECNLF